jgi:hypothetical protein
MHSVGIMFTLLSCSQYFNIKSDQLELVLKSLSLHRAFRRVIQSAHQLMHIHKIFYIKTFKIFYVCALVSVLIEWL